MFHRPLLDVPDPCPTFCSTPPPTEQTALPMTRIRRSPCATPHGRLQFGRLVEPTPLTGYERKSEHTPINYTSRRNSFDTDCNDLTTTVAASEPPDITEVGQSTSPLLFQEREVSSNPFCVSCFQQQLAASGSQQQASSSVVNPWLSADVWGTRKLASVEGTLSRGKRDRDLESVQTLSERRKSPCLTWTESWIGYSRRKSPCLPWTEIIWGWGRNGHKKLGTKKCWYCPVWNQSRTRISEIGALSGESMGRWGSQRKVFFFWRTGNEKENRARDCHEIEELRRICCEETDRVRQLRIDELSVQERNPSTVRQLLTQIQDVQKEVNSLTDTRDFYDPETASSSGSSHAPSPSPEYSESQRNALPRFCIAARYTEYYGYFRKRFWKPTCSRRTILSFLRAFKEFGMIFLRIGIRVIR